MRTVDAIRGELPRGNAESPVRRRGGAFGGGAGRDQLRADGVGNMHGHWREGWGSALPIPLPGVVRQPAPPGGALMTARPRSRGSVVARRTARTQPRFWRLSSGPRPGWEPARSRLRLGGIDVPASKTGTFGTGGGYVAAFYRRSASAGRRTGRGSMTMTTGPRLRSAGGTCFSRKKLNPASMSCCDLFKLRDSLTSAMWAEVAPRVRVGESEGRVLVYFRPVLDRCRSFCAVTKPRNWHRLLFS